MVLRPIYAVIAACCCAVSAQAEIVLLDFMSPNCGPCRQMTPIIARLAEEGFEVRKIDITRQTQVARRWNVSKVPTFVILSDGVEVSRQVGLSSYTSLAQTLRNASRTAAKNFNVNGLSPDSPATFPATSRQASPLSAQDRSDASGVPLTVTEQKLLSHTVRLRVEDPTGFSWGTGTIIDTREGEALVATCGHIFRDSQKHPNQSTIWIETFEAGPTGPEVVQRTVGTLISFDMKRDVGLVSFRPQKQVVPARVARSQETIVVGNRASSVGCNRGDLPTVRATRITALNRYHGPENIEASGAPVEGRSGGGLFDESGQLIGICFASEPEGNEGLYAGLKSIHQQLAEIGLHELAQPASATPRPNATPRVAVAPIPAGEPLATADSVSTSAASAPIAEDAATIPAGLSPEELATWLEIAKRTAKSEVICIIRPQEPGGKSEVISLPQASPAFVAALLKMARPGNRLELTSNNRVTSTR